EKYSTLRSGTFYNNSWMWSGSSAKSRFSDEEEITEDMTGGRKSRCKRGQVLQDQAPYVSQVKQSSVMVPTKKSSWS
ncbi:hypothetical protein BGZ83_000465, partial [Gryganskiella cystojenkinii]